MKNVESPTKLALAPNSQTPLANPNAMKKGVSSVPGLDWIGLDWTGTGTGRDAVVGSGDGGPPPLRKQLSWATPIRGSAAPSGWLVYSTDKRIRRTRGWNRPTDGEGFGPPVAGERAFSVGDLGENVGE